MTEKHSDSLDVYQIVEKKNRSMKMEWNDFEIVPKYGFVWISSK